MKPHTTALTILATVTLLATLTTPTNATAATGDNWSRVAGQDRYDTSLKVAQAAYPNGANKVYVVSGVNYPDALSAASYSDGPVLLADPNNPTQTRQHLATLGTQQAVLIGGQAALPESFNQITTTVSRVAGQDRYDTSLKVAQAAYPNGANKVYVVSGVNYPDALSAASYSDGPVLLARPGQAENWPLQKLGNPTPILIGGTNALPLNTPQPTANTIELEKLQNTINNWPKIAGKTLGDDIIPYFYQTECGGYIPATPAISPANLQKIISTWKKIPKPAYAPVRQPFVYETPADPETGIPALVAPDLAACAAAERVAKSANFIDTQWLRQQEDINFQLVNQHRTKLGLKPLKRRTRMDQFEQWLAEKTANGDRADEHYTEHDIAQYEAETGNELGGHDGDFAENLTVFSLQRNYPHHSAQRAFDAWMESPGHRVNIENPNYEYFGVGFAIGKDSFGQDVFAGYQLFR